MKRLRDICAAVVDNNLPTLIARHAALLRLRERTHVCRQRSRTYTEVNEARRHGADLRKEFFPLQFFRHSIRNLERALSRLFGNRHCAVALVFAEIRTVRELHRGLRVRITGCGERARHTLIHCFQNSLCRHVYSPK